MSNEEEYSRQRDALSMSIVGTKGLLNPMGENNCFLNSAVQVWRCSYWLFGVSVLTFWVAVQIIIAFLVNANDFKQSLNFWTLNYVFGFIFRIVTIDIHFQLALSWLFAVQPGKYCCYVISINDCHVICLFFAHCYTQPLIPLSRWCVCVSLPTHLCC